MILPRLTDFDTFLPCQDKPMALPVIRYMILLKPGARRQKDVGQIGGGCHEKINGNQKL